MKKIYILFVLLNVLVMGPANAQSYPFCNIQYTVDTIPFNPDPFNMGTNVSLTGQDTNSAITPIGFTFNFYGNNYSSLVVSPLGYVTFDTAQANHLSAYNIATGLPNPQNPRNSIFLCWHYDGMTFFNNTIKYNTTGVAPYRRCVISYDSVKIFSAHYYDSVWYATAEIILYETTNIIETHTRFMPYSYYTQFLTMCFGVQNEAGTSGTVPSGSLQIFTPNRGIRYSPYTTPMASIPICMVGVDSATNKNLVIWNQPIGIPVDSFIIYKETSQAGVYAQIGAQPRSAFSTFIDMGSNPAVQANRYKLGFRDSCGTVALQSANHKTVHLTVNAGMGNSWNLLWDAYEGFTFSSYNIYRGTSPSNMTLLTTIANNLFSYTDLTPPSTVYYAIEVVNPGGCNPSARMANNFSSSRSNIVNPITTGIASISNSNISIYPNPASATLNIHQSFTAPNEQVIITDILGHEVYKAPLTAIDNTIEFTKWSSGVYFYEVKGSGLQIPTSIRGKFIKL